MSRPSVHPVPPPETDGLPLYMTAPPAEDDFPCMAGTTSGFVVRLVEFALATISACLMCTTSVFTTFFAFRYLVGVSILLSAWSLSMALVDLYASMVKRSLMNLRFLLLCLIGDTVVFALAFESARASLNIMNFFRDDFRCKFSSSDCLKFEVAISTVLASVFFLVTPFMLFHFGELICLVLCYLKNRLQG